jgi:hypothetical protein
MSAEMKTPLDLELHISQFAFSLAEDMIGLNICYLF